MQRYKKKKDWSNTGTSGDYPGPEVKAGQPSVEFLGLALNCREQVQYISYITVGRTESKSWDLGQVRDQLGKTGGQKSEKTTTPDSSWNSRDNTVRIEEVETI